LARDINDKETAGNTVQTKEEGDKAADHGADSDAFGEPAPWMPQVTRDMTAALPVPASDDAMGLPPCRTNTYKELGETVMSWLSALTARKEHGVPRLTQQTMVKLGVPVDGVMDVYNDHATVRRVFEAAARTNADGRATPRAEDALKTDWMRLESTKSTNKIYLWYKRTQEKAITYGIPLMPFRGIVLRHGAHGLCIPGFGLDTYDTCGKLLLDVMRVCMPDDSSEIANNIRESQTCYANGFEFMWYVLKVVLQMMESHVSPQQSAYNGDLAQHAGKCS
jgi:hypothetical protein